MGATLTYRDRDSIERTGEIWSNGPLPGTVWVLDPDEPTYGARPVRLRTARELWDYYAPEGCRLTVNRADYRWALRRERAREDYNAWQRKRNRPLRWSEPDRGPCPENATDDELADAQRIIDTWEREQVSRTFYAEAHKSAFGTVNPKVRKMLKDGARVT